MEEFETRPTFWLPNFLGASDFPLMQCSSTASVRCTQAVAASMSWSLGEEETHDYWLQVSLVFLPVTCQQSVPLGRCTCWSSGCVHLHTLFQSTLSVQSPTPLGLCCSIQLCQRSAVEECVWLKLLEVELVSCRWISRHKLTDHFQYCIVLLIIPPHAECLGGTVENMEQCPSLHRACNKWAGLPSFSTQPGLHCGIVCLVLYSRGASNSWGQW